MSRKRVKKWFEERRQPPAEMPSPEAWLLSDEDYDRTLDEFVQGSFPDHWLPAEKKLRSDRRARTLLMREKVEGELRVEALLPDEPEAQMLLREALPHLPEELAERVRQFLGK